jgi:penicillin-binding protein-related factor A (putative recombinase)
MKKELSPGKQFEKDFENSVPESCFAQRLNDSPTGSKNEKNPCDYLVYDGNWMYGIECKSYDANTIPIHENHIKDYQINGLCEMMNKRNCSGWFLLNFRKKGSTYFVPATYIRYLRDKKKLKSINVARAIKGGVEITASYKNGKTRYDLSFLE